MENRHWKLTAGAALLLLPCLLSVGWIVPASSSMVKGRAIMCYWGSWSIYRTGIGKYDTTNIDPQLCSHIIYSFAGLRNASMNPAYTIYPVDPWTDLSACENGYHDSYAKLVALRQKNPQLKILLAIGGWNLGSQVFSNMSSSATDRQTFIASVVKYLLRYDFDGLDLDWEYPAGRDGRPEDKPNFTFLVKELRAAFDGVVREPGRDKLQLTAALPAGIEILQAGFELANISRYLNYINLMAYDMHTASDGLYLYHHAGMDKTGSPDDADATNNIKSVVDFLFAEGVPPKQLILGLPAYGRGFELSDPWMNGFLAPAKGPSMAFSVSQEPGAVFYFELCDWMMKQEDNVTVVRDSNVVAPYVFNGRYWFSFDDPTSIMAKAEYAVAKGLGGAMVWSIESDDFKNICDGVSTNPILTTLRMVFETSRPLM